MIIKILGNPVAQGRPRAFRRGSFIGMYDPKKSKDWKSTVARQAVQQGASMLSGALKMDLIFFMPRPKSLSKKIIYHTKKPDLDNLVKAIKDALEGICYKNDSQVVESSEKKIYANDHEETAGVWIKIEAKDD